MADHQKLSKEAFLQMASQLGLDTNDAAHMDELYGHVQKIMDVVADLRKIDLGETEPASTFSPVRE